MGADVDTTGTILSAGMDGQNPVLDFFHRSVKGKSQVPTGTWVHLAYTYDAQHEEGTVYLNGALDKVSPQKAYAGPLETIASAPSLSHGKFAVDEVLVTRTCMPKRAVQDLFKGGVEGLCKANATTEWRSLSAPLKTVQTMANIPPNSSIKLIVETGDGTGKGIDSKAINLQSGEQSIALEGLKPGAEVRLRVELTSAKLGASPSVQNVSLHGTGAPLRWSTVAEWKKASTSGGLTIGN